MPRNTLPFLLLAIICLTSIHAQQDADKSVDPAKAFQDAYNQVKQGNQLETAADINLSKAPFAPADIPIALAAGVPASVAAAAAIPAAYVPVSDYTKSSANKPASEHDTKPASKDPVSEAANKPAVIEPVTAASDAANKPAIIEPATAASDAVSKAAVVNPVSDAVANPDVIEPVSDTASQPAIVEPATIAPVDTDFKADVNIPVSDTADKPAVVQPVSDTSTDRIVIGPVFTPKDATKSAAAPVTDKPAIAGAPNVANVDSSRNVNTPTVAKASSGSPDSAVTGAHATAAAVHDPAATVVVPVSDTDKGIAAAADLNAHNKNTPAEGSNVVEASLIPITTFYSSVEPTTTAVIPTTAVSFPSGSSTLISTALPVTRSSMSSSMSSTTHSMNATSTAATASSTTTIPPMSFGVSLYDCNTHLMKFAIVFSLLSMFYHA